jgi:hypothetical protein
VKNKTLLIFLVLLGFFIVEIATVFHVNPLITILSVTIDPLNNIPLLTMLIEGKQCHVDFDSGSQYQLRLKKEILNTITKKRPFSPRGVFDIKGNEYKEPSFRIFGIKMENMILNDMKVLELNENFLHNIHIAGNLANTRLSQGILGLDAFRNKNLLFDFAHSSLIVCNDKKALESQGYHLSPMTQVPFEHYKKCIFITAETDVGPLKLIIDSGASLTIVRSSIFQEQLCQKSNCGLPKFITTIFTFNGKDFGPQDLMLFDITNKLVECDGVLGMDFLLKHQLYIDHQGKTVYIG